MLDREDFKILAIALEDTTPPSKRFVELLSIDNNVGPFSSANISIDPEFACFL